MSIAACFEIADHGRLDGVYCEGLDSHAETETPEIIVTLLLSQRAPACNHQIRKGCVSKLVED